MRTAPLKVEEKEEVENTMNAFQSSQPYSCKKHKYYRAKYFDIRYGSINKDPAQKSKELPEWAKGVDTN